MALIEKQIIEALENINKRVLENLIIAYEPVWAIGKNAVREAKAEEFQEIKIFIKKILTLKFGAKNIANVKIIYGGSVDENNIFSFLREGEADGFLVGRVSLDSKKFSKLINNVENFI